MGHTMSPLFCLTGPQFVLVEPQKRLSCAAQFLRLVGDQPDHPLNPSIRILLDPVAGLHVVDRRADDKFDATRLLVAGRERALAKEVEFILVDPAVPSTRII